jgi:hypothetical protein
MKDVLFIYFVFIQVTKLVGLSAEGTGLRPAALLRGHTAARLPPYALCLRRTSFVAIRVNNAGIPGERTNFTKNRMLVCPFFHIFSCQRSAAFAAPGILVRLQHLFLSSKHFTGLY